MHATYDSSPDFLHNEVEAWELPDRGLHPIILRRPGDPASETDSLQAFIRILGREGGQGRVVNAEGKGNLSQLMSLCYTLDVASYYAAILRGVEPFEIGLIDELKRSR